MKRSGLLGFTLIELLTVIAIIAILAAITLVAGPRLIEMAKKRSLDATMHELRTQLAQYFADHGTFPPRYGYVDAAALKSQVEDPQPAKEEYVHYLKPYLAYLGLHKNEDFYDNFSEGYDTDRDNVISLLEYSPIGTYDAAKDRYDLTNIRNLYDGINDPDNQIPLMLEDSRARRPLIYVPVNLRQFEKFRQYWIENPIPEPADPNEQQPAGAQFVFGSVENLNNLPDVIFPPTSYDAFVLISVGPAQNTNGVTGLANDPAYQLLASSPRWKYHLLGMRTFFLATRDLNENGALDFHYDARRTGEASVGYYDVKYLKRTDPSDPQSPKEEISYPTSNKLPDPRAYYGYGPYIFVYQ